VLYGPEGTALYKTLAHPVRQLILRYLGYNGAANSTGVAKALGESTGTTSYHLRKLAEQNLVEEIAERSTGRERWWRTVPKDLRHTSRMEMDPEQLAAAEQFNTLRMTNDLEVLIRAYSEWDTSDGWIQASRGGTFMTKDELLRFYEEYLALLWKYGHSAEDAPEGAREVAVRFVAVPVDPPDDLKRHEQS
jgi:DNA-binding MarR family transcriptional regulator